MVNRTSNRLKNKKKHLNTGTQTKTSLQAQNMMTFYKFLVTMFCSVRTISPGTGFATHCYKHIRFIVQFSFLPALRLQNLLVQAPDPHG